MLLTFISFAILLDISSSLIHSNIPADIQEDAKLRVPGLIQKYRYPVEIHHVITDDGYILTMHRIPHGKFQNPNEHRQVVFLQHGLLCSSADYVLTGPDSGLAYILADAGYDVWMGNARGNTYSRNHTVMSPKDPKFWQFSWHQIAVYDIPSMIDYVLAKTGEKDLFHIGHSQGTTTFYIMCSERPKYNKKIKAHFSLAPVAFMKHLTSPLFRLLAYGIKFIDILLESIGVNEFLPNSKFMALAGKAFCKDDAITQVLCSNALFITCGFNKNQLNTTLLPVIMGHTPAGSATKQFVHYAQEILSGYFRQWDYGYLLNNIYYHRTSPPNYELHRITAPVYLIYSRNDWLSHEIDVQKLRRRMPNVKAKYLVRDPKWNHLDYLYGIDAKELVYLQMIEWMKEY